MKNYLNEASLSKILALGGGLAGATIAGADFINDVHQGENIDPIVNPEASTNNTINALADAMKIPVYGIGGLALGGATGLGLNAMLNDKNDLVKTKSKRTTSSW